VSVADVHPAFLKANVRPLGGRGRKCCARRSDTYRRLAAPVKMENRVIGVHGHDRVQIMLGPGGTVASSQPLDLVAHQLPFCSVCVREPNRLVLIGRTVRFEEKLA